MGGIVRLRALTLKAPQLFSWMSERSELVKSCFYQIGTELQDITEMRERRVLKQG